MYNYIINPINKKKVNIKSKSGTKILQNYMKLLIGSGKTKKTKKTKNAVGLETINEGEERSILTTPETLCQIRGTQFCKNFAPLFKSPINILNKLSHNEENKLNDIILEDGKYIRQHRISSGKNGASGSMIDCPFENPVTNSKIIISEKVTLKPGDILEELILLNKFPYIDEICPHIIPIRNLDNKLYMLRGDGDLSALIRLAARSAIEAENATKSAIETSIKLGTPCPSPVIPKFKIGADMAHQIINCLKQTLLCLLKYNIYYFDLKPANVIYKCIDDTMYIWLIDLGSMVPEQYSTGYPKPPHPWLVGEDYIMPDGFGKYSATYPHPVLNNKLNLKIKHSGFITGEQLYNKEQIKDIYAYQLSQLFFRLIGIDNELHYKNINKFNPYEIINSLQLVIDKVSTLDYKYRLTKKYIGVFKEIIEGINILSSEGTHPVYTIPNHEDFWQ